MTRFSQSHAAVDHPEGWWLFASDGQDGGTGLASWPFAMPAFFLGWVSLGVLVALILARRGHDRRTMLALGIGLGPLMLLVASETVRHREREAHPFVIEPGTHLGGRLDVLVLVRDDAQNVRSVLPSLEAARPDLGTLTLARTVAYEWLEGDLDNEVVMASSAALVAANDLVSFPGARLELSPGTPETVARRFNERQHQTVVLFAVDETAADTPPQTRP